jgi:hypothetical protein
MSYVVLNAVGVGFLFWCAVACLVGFGANPTNWWLFAAGIVSLFGIIVLVAWAWGSLLR